MDCDRCGGELETYSLEGNDAYVCYDCGFVDTPVEHESSKWPEPEPWENAIQRFLEKFGDEETAAAEEIREIDEPVADAEEEESSENEDEDVQATDEDDEASTDSGADEDDAEAATDDEDVAEEAEAEADEEADAEADEEAEAEADADDGDSAEEQVA